MKHLFIGTLLVCSTASAFAQSVLAPGAKAPAIKVAKWLKGKPVNPASKGLCVVEFWATWCAPCKEMMPHLSELARKNPDVKFASISVKENKLPLPKIQSFVDSMGDSMDYNVAADKGEWMSKNWLGAAKITGIPVCFLTKDGIVQWIGHPEELAKVIADVRSGTFNLSQARDKFLEEYRANAEAEQAYKGVLALNELIDKGEGQKALRLYEELVAKYPKQGRQTDDLKLKALAYGAPQRAEDFAAEMLSKKKYFSLAASVACFRRQHPLADKLAASLFELAGEKDAMIGFFVAVYYINAKNKARALQALDTADRVYAKSGMNIPDIPRNLAERRKQAEALK